MSRRCSSHFVIVIESHVQPRTVKFSPLARTMYIESSPLTLLGLFMCNYKPSSGPIMYLAWQMITEVFLKLPTSCSRPSTSHSIMSRAFSTILLARDPKAHESHSRGESIGLVLDALAGLASAISALAILILIFVRSRAHFGGNHLTDSLPAAHI